jgi:hypothetical protein
LDEKNADGPEAVSKKSCAAFFWKKAGLADAALVSLWPNDFICSYT